MTSKSSESPVPVSTRMPNGVRESKERHARKVAERTRLEQEARDDTEFVLDRLALQGNIMHIRYSYSFTSSKCDELFERR